MRVDVAALTSKGQFTVPRKFHDLLRLSAGSKMIVVRDGEHLLLKPIQQPEAQSFRPLIRQLLRTGANLTLILNGGLV